MAKKHPEDDSGKGVGTPAVPEANRITGPLAFVSRRAADRVRGGHPWIYSSDVEKLMAPGGEEVTAGSLISVMDARGSLLGTAIYSSSSLITLRMVAGESLSDRGAFLELLRGRMRRAVKMRLDRLQHMEGTNACRLIFAEADELPGIVVDRYDDLVILQLLTQGTYFDDVRSVVVDVVREMLTPATIVERPDARIRELEQLAAAANTPLYTKDEAAPKLSTLFALNDLQFHFDANAGQKTGAFLDQQENYAAAARHGHGRVLDICTYQGGFALHLARKCAQVTGVDASRSALEVAEMNLNENRAQLAEGGRGVEWIEANAFDLLRDWSDTGEEFDTIVLDPPAFAKSKRATEGALRGYKEMNLRAIKMLRKGGMLVTCSCSHHVPLADFQAIIAAAAGDSGKRVRLIEIRGAAYDHPAILTIPETQYLKCLICVIE